MLEANRVAKNTGFLYIKMAITVFISLYATRLVLSALGSKDFGLFSVVGGAIAMLGFLNASMSSATQRFMSFAKGEGNSAKINKIFNMSVLLHLIIAFIIFLILEIAGYFFFNGFLNIDTERLETAKLIYQFMILSTLFSVISVPYDALLNAHENMLFYALLGIIESLLKLTIAISITYISGDKLLYYGAMMAILSIMLLIIYRLYCQRNYPESKIDIKSHYDYNILKEISGYASWSLLGSSSSMIAQYGQGIVLNVFFGTVVNAAQGVANQVSGQLGAFAATMLKALNPVIAKSEGAGNRYLVLKAAMMGSKVSFFLLMFFFIPVLIEMPYVFKIWLKEIPEYAIIFCRLYLIRNLIDQMFVTLNTTISAVGNIQKYQIVSSILYILPLIFTYVLFLLAYPPYTLYIVFIVFALIMALLNLYFSSILCDLSIRNYFKQVILRCTISFIVVFVFALIPVYFIEEGFVRFLSILFMTMVSFFLTIWFIGFSYNEREKIGRLTKNVIDQLRMKILTHKSVARPTS